MDSSPFGSSFHDTCRWCGLENSDVRFENVNLCNSCNQDALAALKNPRLCDNCATILTDTEAIQALFSEYGFAHLFAYGLRLQARNGCELCRMFLLQDPNTDPARLWRIPLSLFARRLEGSEATKNLQIPSFGNITSIYFNSEPDQTIHELSVSASEEDPASRYISQRPPELDLSSERTNQQVRCWLDECMTRHPESLPKNGQSFVELPPIPTRVLDVGISTSQYLKLFQPPLVVNANYLTLSYCWGTQRFLTTTTANINAHRENLDFTTLPQTFQDAITTTRNLGFRYLWIDALCIIQDSNEDKANEINATGNIYSNAFLTIAVVGASRVADGFLKTKPQRAVVLPYRCADGTIGSVRVAPQQKVDLWQESLYTRGWCLQENLLSRRLLLYTDTEVVWQCESSPVVRDNSTHCDYLYDLPEFRLSPFRRLPASVLNHGTDKNADEIQDRASTELERWDTWIAIVQNYTRRRLTVGSDRLPALDGIAQKFREAWSDEYVAGHWKRQFIPSLSWRRLRYGSKENFLPLAEYRAPSWSWASIDGPAEFDIEFKRGSSRGLHAKLISVGLDNDSGKEDEAVLEASVIPATQVPEPRNHSWHVDHDVKLNCLVGDALLDIWCMLLTEGQGRSGKQVRTLSLLLMVKPGLEGPESGMFQRVGVLESTEKKVWKLWANPKTRRVVRLV